jgi:tRNA(fMet)-specific endonuclease VapC
MTVTYMLDTNTVSYIAKGNSPAARASLEALGMDEAVCISSITEAELRYGLARRPAAQALRASVERLLLKFNILPWGSKEAAAYGALRAKLEVAGIVLSQLDLQIAAHAIALGAVLVTNDKAFQRVTDLGKTVNWAMDV